MPIETPTCASAVRTPAVSINAANPIATSMRFIMPGALLTHFKRATGHEVAANRVAPGFPGVVD
jgi:hypothetical protein